VSPTTTWPASTASGTPRSRGKDKTSDGPHRVLDDPDAPKPNSLVPACGILAVDETGRILLQRRRDTGQWALPMGKMELGETPSQYAIRETLEETGVTVAITGILGIYSDPAHIVAYTHGEVRQEYELMFTAAPSRANPPPTTKPATSPGSTPTNWASSTSMAPSTGRSTTTWTPPTPTSTESQVRRSARG
jgi:ADP-ribose pyrophosphatase YjhB (NUDIX family)